MNTSAGPNPKDIIPETAIGTNINFQNASKRLANSLSFETD